MRVLLLKHFDFDDESAVTGWAEERGHDCTIIDPSIGGILSDMEPFDFLVVLGGPMSVYEEERYPWLAEEKKFILGAVRGGKAVLGICLGGQLLAEVLGGKVYRHEHKEIGFHSIRRTGQPHPLFEGMPDRFHSYQWHGDAFDLPPGADRLAYSEACRNQAFAYGPNVLGTQFHLESTPTCIETMLNRWSGELQAAPYIQNADRIREQLARTRDSHAMLHGILDRFERNLSS